MTDRLRLMLGLPAPAKLNLFLHVVGRRADGYHELQTAFVAIDLADTLDFELRADGRIERGGDLCGPPQDDLAVRAARLLQQAAGSPLGASIEVVKTIPTGAGLGGGSSDAATTLLALNRLWRLQWPRERLAELGARLGADVPFFLGPGPAFAEGIGERLTPVALPRLWFALVYPQVHVSTAEVFGDSALTRNTKRTTISGFSAAVQDLDRIPFGSNDLEPVVRGRVAEVDRALELLGRFGVARMTGSGSAVYSAFRTQVAAEDAVGAVRASMPAHWSAWAVRALGEHPLAAW